MFKRIDQLVAYPIILYYSITITGLIYGGRSYPLKWMTRVGFNYIMIPVNDTTVNKSKSRFQVWYSTPQL